MIFKDLLINFKMIVNIKKVLDKIIIYLIKFHSKKQNKLLIIYK